MLPLLGHDSRVLDCGCGPGSITNDFGTLSPSGFVIGVDIEPNQCRAARQAAREIGIRNTFYETQDVLDLEFANETFDVVFAHALLEHVREPDVAIAQMLRVLRPGGVVALRSGDWSGLRLIPPSPAAQRCVSSYIALVRASGGNAAGAELGALLHAAGAEDIRGTVSEDTYRQPVLIADALRAALRTSTDQSEPSRSTDDSCDALRDWAGAPGSIWVERWKEALATKPRNGQPNRR